MIETNQLIENIIIMVEHMGTYRGCLEVEDYVKRQTS